MRRLSTRSRWRRGPALLPSLALAAALRPAEAATAADDGRSFEQLVEWLQAGIDKAGLGDRHPPLKDTFELSHGAYGRSLAARRDVPAGELLALLPAAHLIYDRDYARQEDLQGFEPWQEAAVFLARQRLAGQASPWAPMLATMPQEFPDLPRNWDDSLLEEHLQGSTFPDLVRSQRDETRQEWEQVKAATNLSWEDYRWGHDVLETRSASWSGAEREGSVMPRRRGTNAFYPLFDFFPHGLPNNVDFTFDSELQAVRLVTTEPVAKGELFFIAYFTKASSSNNRRILSKWGFAAEGVAGLAIVSLPAVPGRTAPGMQPGQALTFALERTAWDGAAESFLAVLRARAAEGPMEVRRELPEGTVGVPDPSSGWVYWWNQLTGETTWVLPGDPDRPYFTPATTWAIEAPALRAGSEVLTAALAAYPQTMLEDEELLGTGGPADPRVRCMVLLRRDEKSVLTWWLRLFQRALEREGPPEAAVDAAELYGESSADAAAEALPPAPHPQPPDEL